MKTITKTLLVLLINTAILQAQITQKWLKLGSGFSKNQTSQPSMVFDRNGNLYLAYTDQSTPQNKATLKKFDGQTWTTISSQFTPGQAQFITLQLDTADVPYIAFQEPYPVTKKITVMKYNGLGWDTVGTRGFATADFNNPELSFVFDLNNRPHIAYRDNSTGKASLIIYNGTNWPLVSNITNITEGNATKLSLSVYSNYVYLAFSNGHRGNKLSVITQTIGGGWVYVGDTILSAGAVDYVNCNRFVNSSVGYHAIAYKDLTDGKAYIKTKLDNSIWSVSTTVSDGLANYVTLAKKRQGLFDGFLYCGYADGTSSGNATVRKTHVSVSTASATIGKKGFTDTLGIFAGAFFATLGIDKQDSLYMAVQSFNEYVVFKYRSINGNLAGISTNYLPNEVSIFPNPTEDQIHIISSQSLISSVKLFNLNGKVLYEAKLVNEPNYLLDLSQYPKGFYFIEINESGKVIRTKIIKQ